MEQKIKLITDSASDIPKDLEKKYDIGMLCFHVTLGSKAFDDRDFPNEEFYDMMFGSSDFPTHSQITAFEFDEVYKKYYKEGYTDIIYVCIASKGSNTFSAATMAKNTFFEENPEVTDKFKIHLVDSGGYTGIYGYPVIQSAIKLSKGARVDEILSYLEEWLSKAQVTFGCYTLEYVKRSGRVSTAAAFVGEMLGLRPIIKIKDGISSTLSKVRGDKAIIPKVIEITASNMIPKTPYCLVYGSNKAYRDELEKEITKKLGYPPEMSFQIGAAIASNAGPIVAGVIYKEK